jgi:MFS transporter, ACS family, tartrate transporter
VETLADKAFGKAARRLVPFLGLLYFVNFLDRVNVGFAALQMNADLKLSPGAFGFGAGIFFLAYAVLEVPSNIVLERVGARRWMFRIMLSWGVLSALTALVWNATSFYALRFLLGAAEAGFFPGIIFYLACWFPAHLRARMVAGFMAAVPLAGIIGSPLSGLILRMHGMAGVAGWKWLFLIEGVPAIALAFAVLVWLPDGPKDARWLTADEREAVAARLAQEPPAVHHRLGPTLADPRVWLLSLAYFGIVLSLYGLSFWLPQIVHQMGFSSLQTGLVVAVPYVLAAAAMVLWGRRSDRRGERIAHFVRPALLAAAGFAAAACASGQGAIFAALTLATVGIYACFGPFWTVPAEYLRGPAAAGGIALINSIGNLGGFAGPWILGLVKQATGAYAAGLGLFAAVAVAAALIMVLSRRLLAKPLAGCGLTSLGGGKSAAGRKAH